MMDNAVAFGEPLSGRELVMKARLHRMAGNPLVAVVELLGQQSGWNDFVGVVEPTGGNGPLLARELGPPPKPLPHMTGRQVDSFVHLRLANGTWHEYVGVIEPGDDVHPDRG